MDEVIHIDCVCGSPDHILRFNWNPEDGELYTEVQLVQYQNLFRRIWVAIKYVFGYECRYGHWDCTIMDRLSAKKLNDFLTEHLSKLEPFKTKETPNGN